jgi:hypothetical protein
VWDVPEGAFANESEYESMTGQKLTVRKGAPLFVELKEKMDELRAGNVETEMQVAERKALAAEKKAKTGQVEEETGEVKAAGGEQVASVDALDAELMADLDSL